MEAFIQQQQLKLEGLVRKESNGHLETSVYNSNNNNSNNINDEDDDSDNGNSNDVMNHPLFVMNQ